MLEEIIEEEYVSPLVVHKKNDASYQETANEVGMQTTHIDEDSSDEPTLERHRFKKKKKKKHPIVIVIIVLLIAAVFFALVKFNVISLNNNKNKTTAPQTTKSYMAEEENKFEGVITVKGNYIFFEGVEVEGVDGLEREVKYLDEGTSFVIQDEHADSNLLNFEILSMLSKYKFNYDITHIASSGLVSVYETTAPPETVPETQPQTEGASAE